jgi:hypothetical protein
MTKGVGKKLSYNPSRRSRGKKKDDEPASETQGDHAGDFPSSAGGDEHHDGDDLVDRVLKEQEDSLPVLGMMSSDVGLLGSEPWTTGPLGDENVPFGGEEHVSQQIHVDDQGESDEIGLSSAMEDEDAVMEDSVGEPSITGDGDA